MQTAATEIPLFVVGRVFAGLGVGLISCLVPMYQSEWYVILTFLAHHLFAKYHMGAFMAVVSHVV